MFPSSTRGAASTPAFMPSTTNILATELSSLTASSFYPACPHLVNSTTQAAFTVAIMSEISSAPGHIPHNGGVANNRPSAANPALSLAHQSPWEESSALRCKPFSQDTLLLPISAHSAESNAVRREVNVNHYNQRRGQILVSG